MAAGNTVSIDVSMLGDEALSRIFDRIGKNIASRVLGPSLRRGAKVVKARAEMNAPVRTGNLATHFRITAGGRRGRIGVRVETGRRDEMGIPQDRKYYYPAAVELGTEHTPEQRFLRGALEQETENVYGVIRRHAWKRIEALGLGRDPGADVAGAA